MKWLKEAIRAYSEIPPPYRNRLEKKTKKSVWKWLKRKVWRRGH